MAYAYNEYTGTTDTDYLISFAGVAPGYLSEDHVKFYLNGVVQDNADRTFIDSTHLQIAAPLSTDIIRFQRESSIETALVDWLGGAGVSSGNLDKNTLQMLYIAQESADAGGIDAAESAASAALSATNAALSEDYVAAQVPDWELSNDLTPQLGGDLDMNGKSIEGVSETEMGYLATISSNVQDQIGTKQATLTGATSALVSTNLTADRATISSATGKLVSSPITATELNSLDAVESNIQAQLDTKKVIQVITELDSAMAASATTMDWDDTIPAITEGFEYMSKSFTKQVAASTIRVDAVFNCANSSDIRVTAALFINAVSAAEGAATVFCSGNIPNQIVFSAIMTGLSASGHTVRLRAGGTGGTVTFNGISGSRFLGGVMSSGLIITEYL